MYAYSNNYFGKQDEDIKINDVYISGINQGLSTFSSPTFNNLTVTNTTSTKTLKSGAGTILAPSITFSADPNTGFFNSADGILDISLNGNRAGRLDYTNNLIQLGVSAGLNNSGKNNIAIGSNALSNTTADYNIGLGVNAGLKVSSGLANIAIGQNSAKTTLDTGNNNILIGNSTDTATNTAEYAVAIGNSVIAKTNEIVIGQSTNYTNGISLAVKTGIGQPAGTEMLEVAGNIKATNDLKAAGLILPCLTGGSLTTIIKFEIFQTSFSFHGNWAIGNDFISSAFFININDFVFLHIYGGATTGNNTSAIIESTTSVPARFNANFSGGISNVIENNISIYGNIEIYLGIIRIGKPAIINSYSIGPLSANTNYNGFSTTTICYHL